MLRTALAAIFVVTARHPARSQSTPTAPDSTTWKAWGSLSLGPATANGAGRLSANLSLWVTRDQLAIGLRQAATSRFADPGGLYDLSVLAGIHPAMNPQMSPHTDFVAGLGAGIGRGYDNGGGNLRAVPVLVASANLTFSYRVVGIGLDGFAALGSSRWYYGVGLALAAGWFD